MITMSQEGHALPASYRGISLATVFILILIVIPLTTFVTQSILGLDLETDFVTGASAYIAVGLLFFVAPIAILVEVLYAKWRKRKLRIFNIFVTAAIVLEGILVMIVFSFVVNLVFPGLSFTNEPFVGLAGLVLGLMIGLPVLTIALTSRIPRVRKYFKTMF